MKKLSIIVPLMSLVIYLPQVGQCGLVDPPIFAPIDNAAAYWRVDGTGLNSDLQNSPQNITISTSLTGVDAIQPTTYSVTSYAGSPGNVHEIYSESLVTVSNGKIGVSALAESLEGGLNSPAGYAEATGTWQDQVGLFYSGEGEAPALPYSTLIFNFEIDGSLETSLLYGTENSLAAKSNASLQASAVQGLSQFVSGNDQFEATPNDPLLLSGSVYLGSTGQASIQYSLKVTAQSTWGSAFADFAHTMEIASILFPDGTTPESHGFDVVFESGMQSPNIAPPTAVPEPSTFALLGIGGFALAGYGWRRKRQRAA